MRWSIFAAYAPTLIAGMAVAGALWSGSKLTWFRALIGVYIIVFVAWRRIYGRRRCPPLYAYTVLGLVVGFAAIFVGATGPLIAPFFLRDDFAKENVIATKAICQAATHLLKWPAFTLLGFSFVAHARLLALLVVAVIVGTVVGKRILGQITQRAFVILFEATLLSIALYLVITGLALVL